MSDIDRIDSIIDETLSTPSFIEPSASFAARVMTAVRSEAELPPLAFPVWRFAAAVVFLFATIALGIAG